MSNDTPKSAPLTYRDSGVDIDAGNALVQAIKPLVKATRRPGRKVLRCFRRQNEADPMPQAFQILRYREDTGAVSASDELSAEQPLEIRVRNRAVSVTMRLQPPCP